MAKNLLFTIPHFCSSVDVKSDQSVYGSVGGIRSSRVAAFQSCLDNLVRHFASPRCELDNSNGLIGEAIRQRPSQWQIKVVVCVHGTDHVLDQIRLPPGSEVIAVKGPPQELGFACHLEMAGRVDQYDLFCFLEDDIVISDPLFFEKQIWFHDTFGDESILQPNRYELYRDWHKIYVDGPLPERHVSRYTDLADQPNLTAEYFSQHVTFFRPSNPMSACFFLNQPQLRHWTQSTVFDDRDSSYGSAMESAQILGPMKLFRVYKPTLQNAGFLEVEHHDARLTKARTPKRVLDQFAGDWNCLDE